MTRLRKMMLEELQRRNYSESQLASTFSVTAFARHFGKSPDQLAPNELRRYQAYLLQGRKVTPGTAGYCRDKTSSRLRKKGCWNLDYLQVSRFCDSRKIDEIPYADEVISGGREREDQIPA